MNSPLFSSSWPASRPTSRIRVSRAGQMFVAPLSLLFLACAVLTPAQAQNLTNFGSSAVGTPASQNVTVPVSASGTVASVAVLTMGSPNLDFTEAAAGDTCAGNSFTAPATCTVNVTFSPLYPGPRNGAIVLRDASGNTLGAEYLSGTGQGALAVMIPGTIGIVAGQQGQWTQVNDGQPATQADLYLPSGIAVDGAGDLFIADTKHNRIREVSASTGNIATIAGDGNPGYDPTATVAIDATLTLPGGVALDGAGNLYIADTDNNEILEVNLTTGNIVSRWGNGQAGYAGDGTTANASTTELNAPGGIAVDSSGNIYIADTGNNRIREIDASTGVIATVAGGGSTPGSCSGSTDALGDGCSATSATLNAPYGVAFDPAGDMYIPDSGNNVVRVVNSSKIISIYAGDGTAGYSGDGSAATSAELYSPLGVACDAAGNVYIADARNYVVRKVNGANGAISTIAGNNSVVYNDGKSTYTYGNGQNGEKYSGNGIAYAGIYAPYGVAMDAAGNLYISEYFDNLVRKVTANAATLFFSPAEWVGQVSAPQSQTVENDGNAALSFSAVSSDSNSTIGSASTCSTTGAVAVDAQCAVQAEFSPTTSGNPLVGTISLATQIDSPLTIANVGQALAQNTPVVTVTSGPNPSIYSNSVNFAITVSASPGSTQGTPTGTVTLYDLFPAPATPPTVPNPPSPPPGVLIGTATLGANGTASIQSSTLAVGTHDIYAAYGGDTYYVAANSATPHVQQVNEQVSVTLTNSSGNNPSTWGAAVTFTANVSVSDNVSTSGTSVSFYDGATFLGSAPLDSSNNATYTSSTLAPGNHSITAAYTDLNNVSGSSAAYIQDVKQTTATVVTSNAAGNQSTYGTPVTFTATVTATGTVAPTGNVTFYDGATQLGSQNLTAGAGLASIATLTTSTLGVGSHIITAVYNDDADDFSSTSAAYTLTVNASTTTTTLSASANPAIAGTSVTFTAKVTSSGGNVPTGPVNFYNGSTLLGSGTLNGSGIATYSSSALAVGTYSITAGYQGDTNDGSSTSSPALSFSVIQATTSVKLASSATAVPVTTPVTFTATVTGNGATPAGTIMFMDGTTSLGTANLSGGVATLNTSALPVGSQSITAVYQGDADDAGSTSNAVIVTVRTFSTQTTLAASATTVASNQPVALLATVISSSGKPVAGGTVSFFNGKANLGTATIGANGSASLSITLTAGSDTITAQYSGDTDDAASTSDPVTITVGQATDFSIQLNPASLSIPTSDYANVSVSLASLDGFADNMALGCSSLPPSVTCNFSSTNTSLSANGSASVTLTVDTNSPLAAGSQARNHVPAAPGSSGGGTILAFLLPGAGLLGFWRFRRQSGVLRLIAILAVVAGATMAMNGCGGLSLSSAKPGTYVIQVTATGTKTNVTHVADLTVQVTQ
jgi:large repetitive protein